MGNFEDYKMIKSESITDKNHNYSVLLDEYSTKIKDLSSDLRFNQDLLDSLQTRKNDVDNQNLELYKKKIEIDKTESELERKKKELDREKCEINKKKSEFER